MKMTRSITVRRIKRYWRTFSNEEKVISGIIFFLLLIIVLLVFFPIKKKSIVIKLPNDKLSNSYEDEDKKKGEKKNKALKFTTDDAYFISSASGSITTDEMTVEAIVCIPKDEPGQYNLISLVGDSYDLFSSYYTMEVDGNVDTSYSMLLNNDSYLTATSTITSNTCHHVAVTAEAENGVCKMNVYTDGAHIISAQNDNNCRLSSRPYKQFVIGSHVHGFKSFNGTIDEVRISDTVRYRGSYVFSSDPFTLDEHTQHLFHLDGDTLDAVQGDGSIVDTYGTEFIDNESSITPTPALLISGIPENLFTDAISLTPSIIMPVGSTISPSRTPTPFLFRILSSLTPTMPPSIFISPTVNPSVSTQTPSSDTDSYVLPGPPPISFNQSAQFSFKNQTYVSINDDRMGLSSSFTVEAWVRPIAEPPGLYIPAVIVSKASPQKPYSMPFSLQMGIYLDTIVPYFSVDANNARYSVLATDGSLTYNHWHHIAATVDTNIGRIAVYVDGVLSGQLLVGKKLSIYDPKIETTIGAMCLDENDIGYCSRHSLFYNGEIDEVRISKVVRYSGDFSPPMSPIGADYDTLAIYRFDGNARDSSGRNNHGVTHGPVIFPASTIGQIDDLLQSPTPTELPL